MIIGELSNSYSILCFYNTVYCYNQKAQKDGVVRVHSGKLPVQNVQSNRQKLFKTGKKLKSHGANNYFKILIFIIKR